MANRFWISNTAKNYTDTTAWSTTLGGAGGASIPSGASDNAFFPAGATGTCTFNASITLNQIIASGAASLNFGSVTTTIVGGILTESTVNIANSSPNTVIFNGPNCFLGLGSGVWDHYGSGIYNLINLQNLHIYENITIGNNLTNSGVITGAFRGISGTVTFNGMWVNGTIDANVGGIGQGISWRGGGTLASGIYYDLGLETTASSQKVFNLSGIYEFGFFSINNNNVMSGIFNNSILNLTLPSDFSFYFQLNGGNYLNLDWGTAVVNINTNGGNSVTTNPENITSTKLATLNFNNPTSDVLVAFPLVFNVGTINSRGLTVLENLIGIVDDINVLALGIVFDADGSFQITNNLTYSDESILVLPLSDNHTLEIHIGGDFIGNVSTDDVFGSAHFPSLIEVSGNLNLNGTRDSMLNLNPDNAWNITAHGTNSITWANIKNLTGGDEVINATWSNDQCNNTNVDFGIGSWGGHVLSSASKKIVCSIPVNNDNGSIMLGGNTNANTVALGTGRPNKVRLGSSVGKALSANNLPNYDLQTIREVDTSLRGNQHSRLPYVTAIRTTQINQAGINLETGQPYSTPTVDNSSIAPTGSVTLPTRAIPGTVRFISAAKTPTATDYGSKNT